MSNAVFYGPNAKAPAVLPPWMVVVDSGAWGCQSIDQAREIAAQLHANGRPAKIVTVLA